MSAICQNFVQNAWKKDLCSNCFKSKDEHNQLKQKPIPVNLNKSVEGIIKTNRNAKPKRSVEFAQKLTEVIGYGGEDWSSEDEDDDPHENGDYDDDDLTDSEPDVADGEAEKSLQRLTKSNTDFNANSLQEIPEVKKTSYTQLMLGKPQVDSEGRKQTLLVSVTPFGQDAPPTKKNPKPVSHIPIAKNNKETLTEAKSNVILTSYAKNNVADKEEKSLLDEITETLENCKNPIQIRKKTQKELVLSKPDISSNKENIKRDAESSEKNDSKVKSNIPERKNGITRTPVIKRDQEKPVIYQTSIAKIELMNSKNLKATRDKPTKPEVVVEPAMKQEIEAEKEIVLCNEPEAVQSETDDSIISTSSENSSKDDDKSEIKEIKFDEVGDKIMGLPPQVPKLYNLPQSREQAGEPDGRADPESTEPPALPLTPPPQLETHTSFLHSAIKTCEKPKVPSKPAMIIIRKPAPPVQNDQPQPQILSTFAPEAKPKLEKQDSNGSDIYKAGNKRRAPKPPSPEVPVIYARSMFEKKERFSSCIGDNHCESMPLPEPAPRRSLSLSTDSLCSGAIEEKKKKARFSLKKFLRMGSSKDLPKITNEIKIDEVDLPQPKPRLVIVHPLELNGAKVEVVAKTQQDFDGFANAKSEYMVPIHAQRAAKPPPPPRNYDDYSKPNLPHPPKSQEILNKQKEFNVKSAGKKVETVYANIGEVRSAITPHKPQRTASMREREAQQQKHNYALGKDSNENVYDYITGARSSSPECDSNKNSPKSKSARMKGGLAHRSESNMDVSGEYFKYQNIPRSMSLTYCGSETESEIYSPYSFYGSESEVAEDDHDWSTTGSRTHKLRSRKGRSIVHKNLEDNYGAVIVANHEALAQVLENIQQTVIVQPALRGLKTSSNLTWGDFSIKNTVPPLVVGQRAFHQAVWCNQHVTLVISSGPVPTSTSLGTLSLIPITEFSDLIPVKYLPVKHSDDVKHLQATIAILPWMQVNTIQSYGEFMKSKSVQNNEDDSKETSFILLQLVNALKTLQAQGIEELPSSLSSFVLCREVDKDTHYRLFLLQGLGEDSTRKKDEDRYGTLCVCAATALTLLRPASKFSSLVQSLLVNERAVSLTQMKSVLEFSLWGPSDVALGSTVRERELALQRWLDLQRATVLHGLVCTKVHLTIYEECHLLFLVRSNARMMCDASMLLESNNLQNFVNGHK